jgi:hypothetical protein
MNNRIRQQLLADVLAESSPADLRAAMLAETLRIVRRRRRRQQVRQVGSALAVLLLAGWLMWPHQPGKLSVSQPVPRQVSLRSYQLVETRPLPAGAVVSTGNFSAIKTISTAAAVTQVATTSGGFRYINDAQLLALLGNRPVILIRTGPNSEELVFADPEDQKMFSPR